MTNIKQKVEEGWIYCRVVVEMLGKPIEHVDKSIRGVLDKIKEEKDFIVIKGKLAKPKKRETGVKEAGVIQEMWSTFAEVELLFKDLTAVTYFCFEYMPSSIEIIEPQTFSARAIEMSEFFNDLQTKLHQVVMAAKQMKSKQIFLEKNIQGLLNNFVLVTLSRGELTSEQLAKLSGVGQEMIEDFLDKLIDDGKIEMNGENYRRLSQKTQS